MSVLIGKYEFNGPYENVTELEEKPGLYAVLHCQNDEYELIHVAQANSIRDCLQHSQVATNPTECSGKVLLASYYTPRCGRRQRDMMVEDILREFFEQKKQNEPVNH